MTIQDRTEPARTARDPAKDKDRPPTKCEWDYDIFSLQPQATRCETSSSGLSQFGVAYQHILISTSFEAFQRFDRRTVASDTTSTSTSESDAGEVGGKDWERIQQGLLWLVLS